MSTIRRFEEWTVRGLWWYPPVRPARFRAPAEATIIHHSVTHTAGKSSRRQAQEIEQVIYSRRFTARFSMIAYSYIVSTQGLIYEGRGTTFRNGANNDTRGTGYSNTNTLSICFAGNYHPGAVGPPTLTPTMAQLEAAASIIRHLESTGELQPGSPVLPHRAVHSTACPGDNLAAAIDTIDVLAHAPTPPPPIPEDDDDMPHVWKDTSTGETWICQGNIRRVAADATGPTGEQIAAEAGLTIHRHHNARYLVPGLYPTLAD